MSNANLTGIIKKHKLQQLINKPTRITENRSDLVIYTAVIPCQIAGHKLLTVLVDKKRLKRQLEIKKSRDLSGYDSQSLCQNISAGHLTLLKILTTDDVNRQVDILSNVLKIL